MPQQIRIKCETINSSPQKMLAYSFELDAFMVIGLTLKIWIKNRIDMIRGVAPLAYWSIEGHVFVYVMYYCEAWWLDSKKKYLSQIFKIIEN